MVNLKTQSCPNCDAAPEMDFVGMSPEPNGPTKTVLECPACGHTTTITQGDDDSGGLW